MSGNAPPTVRIQALRNGLQPTERRVADVILDAPEVVVELTAQQLADRAGVARSSVVRACQTFGFRGYPQLRVALAAELGAVAPAASDHGDGALGRVRRSIDRAAAALPASTSLLDADEVERAVTAVVGAGRLLVVANGLSSPVASDLAMRLTAVGRPAEVIADVIAQQISARQLGSRDVCIVVSGSGANEASLRAAAAAASGGAVVIAITSFAASPLVERATHALVIAPAGTSFRDELEHTSRAAHALFVEALADEVAARLPGGASAVRAQVLEVLSDNLGA
ncbi:MurR/RpiR family transcriptional regulator [Microbacterium sp. AISO3]|uniref:RpiR family carbohydrate utilization transcriptional regulator n=1 Tax=Microbacterium paludicola TaxID=300019 RepID=A0ABU1I753_9MICO|nr:MULTISPECIES: MurR/RpiR family transcriptional regulator [Microbacterium]MDR6168814.1 RpiR family carbohydrate utilization transcriptional regulator [Microbacterium paludicola]OWP20723.1 MurR/RpiR family transcriptional regulator [Microbacterium sp. AISO3]POX67630.1 MurR/RpiR family transcriptional regulator [Microbacterium sp. Ru50]GAD33694.1 transcriptional regulator [Microbacterium sp. TS-1]